MTASTACPYCGDSHTLSQCPRWIIAGRPAVNAGTARQFEKNAWRGTGAPPAVAQELQQGGAKASAQTMPETAALVAELRLAFGADVIDQCLAASQRARRDHARLAAQHGTGRADAWLKAQRFPMGRFWACEGGIEVGVRP